MTGSFTLDLTRNPALNKLQSGYVAGNVLTINGTGFGTAPTVAVFENWMNKTAGARAPKGSFDSALYGASGAADYPYYYTIDGVSGIGSRNNKTDLIYTVTAQNNAIYRITIVGSTAFSMTSSGAATREEIVSNLSAQINADSGCKAVASGTTTLILTRKTPSIPFAVYNAISAPTAGYDSAANAGTPISSTVNMVDDNYLTGYIKLLAGNPKDVFVAWQLGTPSGYFFSGASAENTTNGSSNLKSMWFSDQGLDDQGLADFIGVSRPDPSLWSARGNQSNLSVNAGNQLDFGKLLSFMTMHKAGTSPFVDNGTGTIIGAGLAGTVTASKTDKPLFVRRSKFTFTPANTTLYTITINGTLCMYTSGVSATQAEIVDGLRADINSKISNTVGNAPSGPVDLVFDPVSGGLPTITNSANITKQDLNPYFTQVSTIWQGNNNQVNTLIVYPWMYVAVGANCGNYIALGNAGTFSAVTDWKVLKHSTWTDTLIQASYDIKQSAGKTHWYRFVDNVPVEIGLL